MINTASFLFLIALLAGCSNAPKETTKTQLPQTTDKNTQETISDIQKSTVASDTLKTTEPAIRVKYTQTTETKTNEPPKGSSILNITSV